MQAYFKANSIALLIIVGLPMTFLEGRLHAPGLDWTRQISSPQEIVLGEAWLQSPGLPDRRFSTIQAAFDAASDGDRIRLTDGLFRGPGNRNVMIAGKNVRIESINGPSNCVMDCERLGYAFDFTTQDVTNETILHGVTIVRGLATATTGTGGGISIHLDATPLIENCVIRDCHASFSGGGISYTILTAGKNGVILNCNVVECSAGDRGGGVSIWNATIDACTIADNKVGIFCGGVYARMESAIRNSVIARNTDFGGNTNGGGIFFRESVRVESCTIVDNSTRWGGGISTAFASGAVISNCILWGNRAFDASLGHQIDTSFPGPVETLVRYCDLEEGLAGIGGTNPTSSVLAILDLYPEFVDLAAGDLHLLPTSPVIGVGDPDLVLPPFPGDRDGEPRTNGLIDMGADEYWPGLTLAYPSPRVAGVINTFPARGAGPDALVLFWIGSVPGSTPLGIGICPDLTLEIGDASLVGSSLANGSGEAELRCFVPVALAGSTFLLQGTSIEPPPLAPICTTSNLIAFSFP